MPATPGLFTQEGIGTGTAAAVRATDGTLITALNPARRGEVILLYATGLGEVDGPFTAGQPAPVSPLLRTIRTPVVDIGGVPVPVQFSGLAPGFVGLFQLNITISQQVPTGFMVPIKLIVAGQTSNTATIAVVER